MTSAELRSEDPIFRSRLAPNLATSAAAGRVAVKGKLLSTGGKRFFARGVSYGAFRPDEKGREYTDSEQIARDFARMSEFGINTVRIPHTVPPRSLLDVAQRYGLRVMVGLSAEQSIGYLIDGGLPEDFEQRFRAKIRVCARHPSLLCYALGNEIPAPQLRWLGRGRVTAYLRRLWSLVKEEDSAAIVTYVNYPTTEYLELPFLDVVSFNVYLEDQKNLRAYLARLQNVAGSRPLMLTELGLDCLRHGEEAQARSLDWQIRTTFAAGAAGAIVFSWTDEWFRAGAQVEDWAFGITDFARRPKPAAHSVRRAFLETPFAQAFKWPRISVVVCTYNGARTIRDCLDGLLALDYPNYEVIIVNDGSTDDTAAIAHGYPFKLINQANGGLSAARNTGLAASTGSIIVYIDDDAFPDRDWLRYLAAGFAESDHVGLGGPNVQPPGDGLIADCVAHSPGGPVHVLLSDEIAEHIPGCNMGFRKNALIAIGGFDPRFRAAGDDVDICWRLQDRGWTIRYCPAALVWHHRRNSVRAYWKQQYGYGKAEAQLESKWPERYNALGHASWAGRVYSHSSALDLVRQRIYHGVWGTAPFQSVQRCEANIALSLMLTPEYYILVALLAGLGLAGFMWSPLLMLWPVVAAGVVGRIAEAGITASRAPILYKCPTEGERLKCWSLLTCLHVIQPIARLHGRLAHGLTPWRSRVSGPATLPWRKATAIWSERWREPEAWVRHLRDAISRERTRVADGGPYDRWDFEVSGGALATARVLIAVEDHGAGRQYVRIGAWPKCSGAGLAAIAVLASVAGSAGTNAAWATAGVFSGAVALVIVRVAYEAGRALAALERGIAELAKGAERPST